jgi:hypothetical protein
LRLSNILILLTVLLVAGGIYYWLNLPKPAPPQEPRYYAWDVSLDDLQHITIDLPSENKSQSFIKISNPDTFPWYFDDAQQSAVDTKRWGGGIPLLLSGPGVQRYFAGASTDKLSEYGLTKPQMIIDLALTDNRTMNIVIGDFTPDGINVYVLAPHSNNDIGLVDRSWFDVLSALVTDPPYAVAPAKN